MNAASSRSEATARIAPSRPDDPDYDHAFPHELLPEPPTRWYLTVFLTPTDAPIAQPFDEAIPEEIDSPAEPGGLDDDADPDRHAASTSNRSSLLVDSTGVSVLRIGARHSAEFGDLFEPATSTL